MLRRHDPMTEIVNSQTIEQYKSEWKKHGFPDVDFGLKGNRSPGVSNNYHDVTYQPMEEQWLWVAVILEAIADYNQTSVYHKKWCVDCTQPADKINKKVRRHTNQECAANWLAGPDCKMTCEMLGIDVGYFLKQIGVSS